MSNQGDIDVIISEQALKNIDQATVKLEVLYTSFIQLSKSIQLTMVEVDSATGLKTMNTELTSLSTKTKELKTIEQQTTEQRRKLMEATETYNTTLARLKVLTQEQNAANKLAAKQSMETAGSMNALSLALDKARNAYKALGEAERNSGTGTKLLQDIQKLDLQIKTLDATIGKHNRNVGNYVSGFNSLGNSINQLTREMPAFINSAQTGFMAISNNLPALSDAIKGIREQNKALAAEGKPTVSVLSQLSKAFFSWGTAISLGITVLTLYGPKLFELIKGTGDAADKTKKLTAEQEALTSAIGGSSYSKAIQNVNELTGNIKLAREGILDKDVVVKQYNDTIGKTTGLVHSLDEAERTLALNGEKYINYILLKTAAEAASEESAKKIVESMKFRQQAMQSLTTTSGTDDEGTATTNTTSSNSALMSGFSAFKLRDGNELKDIYDYIEIEAKKIRAQGTDIQKIFVELQTQAAGIFSTMTVTPTEAAKKGANKSSIPEKATVKKEADEYQNNLEGLDNDIFIMNQQADERLYKAHEKHLDDVAKSNADAHKENLDIIQQNVDAIEKLDETEIEAERKKQQVLKNLKQETLKAIQAGTSVLADIAEMRADREMMMVDSVEKAQLSSLDRMTMSDKEREEKKLKIELEADDKRKKIEQEKVKRLRKYAALVKATDLMEIVTGTRKAVVLALGNRPYTPANIGLAIAAGLVGAAQFAAAAAAPLPQYYKGRQGGKAEWAEVNEQGAEAVKLKDGTTYIPNQGKRGVTFLPEGADVIPANTTEKLYGAAFVRLAKQGTITTDKLQTALLSEFERNTAKLDKINKTIEGKQFGLSVYGNGAYLERVKSYV